jgi:hypothetical protein
LEAKDVPNQGDWRELMTFVSTNQHVAVVERWEPDQSNIIHLAPGLDAELGELSIRDEPTHWPEGTVWSGLARRASVQLWDYQAWLPVRFMNDGHATTNWGILGGSVCDSSGNKDFFSPLTVEKVLTNDWMLFRVSRPLDPRQTWKFRVDCSRVSNFRDTNVFSFSLQGPLDGPIYTNYAGSPFEIEYSSERTLRVSLLGQLANTASTKRLTLIEAVGDGGEKLQMIGWGTGSTDFSIRLAPSSKPVPLHVKAAVEEIYPATFTLQPRDDRSSGRGGSRATPGKP